MYPSLSPKRLFAEMLYKIDKNSKGITKTKRVPEGNKTKKAISRAARLSRDEDGEAVASAASSWGLPGIEAANPTEMARKNQIVVVSATDCQRVARRTMQWQGRRVGKKV
jgi:hypothetical protein